MPGRLHRRAFVAGAAAAALLGPARAASTLVAPVAAFLDSIGVNTHLTSEPYLSRFDAVLGLIAASGIRHLRDELRPSDDLDRWRRLHAAAGVRAHLLVSPATNDIPAMLDYLRALGPDGVSAIEGQNEGDSDWFRARPVARPRWNEAVVAYQRAVFAALRARHPALPVVSPTVLDYRPADMALLRPAAPFCDVVGIHSYVQHAQEPETTDDYAALDWYLRHMRDPFKPGAPVMSTETGYCNLIVPGGSGVSEAAAGVYIPRLLLNNFAGGVGRTFLYALMDGGTDPAQSEDHWGLVRHDGTPKPAYGAVSALIGALTERGSGAPGTAPVGVAAEGAEADLRILALARPDGGRVYAVWRAVRCWDPARAADVAPAARPQRIVLDRRVERLDTLALNGARRWTEHGPAAEIVLPLGGTVILVRPG